MPSLQEKQGKDVKTILFRIPSDYADVSPNVYAVEQCLKKEAKDRADEHMLLAQAIRFFAIHGKDAGIRMILQADCDKNALAELLKRIEKAWKIPTLWIISTKEETDSVVVNWLLSCEDPTRCRLAIDLSDIPKKRLARLATDYPIGRVVGIEFIYEL